MMRDVSSSYAKVHSLGSSPPSSTALKIEFRCHFTSRTADLWRDRAGRGSPLALLGIGGERCHVGVEPPDLGALQIRREEQPHHEPLSEWERGVAEPAPRLRARRGRGGRLLAGGGGHS